MHEHEHDHKFEMAQHECLRLLHCRLPKASDVP